MGSEGADKDANVNAVFHVMSILFLSIMSNMYISRPIPLARPLKMAFTGIACCFHADG